MTATPIIRKIKRAVTDSGAEVRYAEGKSGINNLMTIYSCFTGKDFEAIEREFDGQGYGAFKEAVGVTVADAVGAIQEKIQRLSGGQGVPRRPDEAGRRARRAACRPHAVEGV